MKKTLLLSSLIVLLAPLRAHAFTNDEILSYTGMPLAVSDVSDVRGVQTDQLGTLVSYMDQANVPPDQFLDVLRYVPVALTLNTGSRPDFVQWVANEVNQGVVGEQLVSLMEQRLASYGDVIPTTRTYSRRPTYYTAYQSNYVPVQVVRYVDYEMLDPFALIDQPVAVANVADLGVPIAPLGDLVRQLDLGGVAPVQTVEVLRYAPTALGQPDFVQYVSDQRVGGITGYDLVQAIDRQLTSYGVSPQIDLAQPVYVAPAVYVPSTINDYVQPVDPTWIAPAVRTQVATVAAPTVVAPRIVTNPGQVRRELAHERRAEGLSMRGPSPVAHAPERVFEPRGHGRPEFAQRRVIAAPPQFVPRGRAEGHEHENHGGPPARVMAPPAPMAVPAPQGPPPGRGNGDGNDKGHGHGEKKGKD